MCDGLIQTLGRVTYGGKLDHPFTAHPKIDPKTGEGMCTGVGRRFTLRAVHGR